MALTKMTADDLDDYHSGLDDVDAGIEACFDGIDSTDRALGELDDMLEADHYAGYQAKLATAISLLREVKEHAEEQRHAAHREQTRRLQDQGKV